MAGNASHAGWGTAALIAVLALVVKFLFSQGKQ